jgi:hypothetical protein
MNTRKPRPSPPDAQLTLFEPPAAVATLPGPAPRRSAPLPLPRPRALAEPPSPETALRSRLDALTAGRLLRVVLTDNRRTILSVRREGPAGRGGLTLRIHRCFAEAPAEVLRAVAEFLDCRRGSERARQALAALREHFLRHRPAVPAPARRRALRPVGAALDLREVADDLNRRFFGGRLAVTITWGRAGGSAAHRCRRRSRSASLLLGSYSYEESLVRVHPALDGPEVPRYVVEAVVFHELLHADLPPVFLNGRRRVHTPEFRRRERQFPALERAERWIQEHLPALLRARDAGRNNPPAAP